LFVRLDRRGRETWYAKVRVGGRQVKKAVGPKREPGGTDGLTRSQAEGRLRKLIGELEASPRIAEQTAVDEAGKRYFRHLATLGRRRSTLENYESYLRVHLVPSFGEAPLDKIGRREVEGFIAETLGDGLAPKSVRNYLGFSIRSSPMPRSRGGLPETRVRRSRSRGRRRRMPRSAFSTRPSATRWCELFRRAPLGQGEPRARV
jgi:Phage integrase, N-terminal SAM-like domain